MKVFHLCHSSSNFQLLSLCFLYHELAIQSNSFYFSIHFIMTSNLCCNLMPHLLITELFMLIHSHSTLFIQVQNSWLEFIPSNYQFHFLEVFLTRLLFIESPEVYFQVLIFKGEDLSFPVHIDFINQTFLRGLETIFIIKWEFISLKIPVLRSIYQGMFLRGWVGSCSSFRDRWFAFDGIITVARTRFCIDLLTLLSNFSFRWVGFLKVQFTFQVFAW